MEFTMVDGQENKNLEPGCKEEWDRKRENDGRCTLSLKPARGKPVKWGTAFQYNQ